jgi:hypothetical protein
MSNTLKALLLTLLASAGSAMAQGPKPGPGPVQTAKYCGNALVANTATSKAKSAAPGSEVEYQAELQNMDTHGREMTATMVQLQKIGTLTVLHPLSSVTLTTYQKKQATLLSLKTPTAAGTGAPTPAVVMNTIRFDCTYR